MVAVKQVRKLGVETTRVVLNIQKEIHGCKKINAALLTEPNLKQTRIADNVRPSARWLIFKSLITALTV